MIYLIVFDRKRNVIESLERWPDEERASASARRLEREQALFVNAQDFEVLILEADDDATLQQNHASYFHDGAALAEALAAFDPLVSDDS